MTDHTASPSEPVGQDVLERLLASVADGDPADAPDVAGAIASVLAARLEGGPLPDEVARLVERLGAAEPQP